MDGLIPFQPSNQSEREKQHRSVPGNNCLFHSVKTVLGNRPFLTFPNFFVILFILGKMRNAVWMNIMKSRLLDLVLLWFFLVGISFPVMGGEPLKSGPQKGTYLPRAFHPLNINGKFGKEVNEKGEVVHQGRYHCLVCEFGLNPVILVFAREKKDEKNEVLVKLLQEIDKAIAEDRDGALKGFVVFLSPYARSSVTEANLDELKKTSDPQKLNAEALYRDELLQQLEGYAAGLKNVIVAAYPAEGPEDYNLSDKAEITVLLYQRHKVRENFAFAPGTMTDDDVTMIMNHVRGLIGEKGE